MRVAALALLLSLAAAAQAQQADCPQPAPGSNWRAIATDDDRERLRDWRTAFTRALDQARSTNAADVDREGVLLQPNAALGGPIPNGNYRCRVIKLGAASEGMLNYIAYPPFRCRISSQGNVQHFDKLSGSQRHHGAIYAADQLRSAFLGTMVLGDERIAYQYGRDPERDLAGWVERIGDNRWRLILPYPRYESTLDVIELVPE
ncbi:MAG TPA: DUF4893 domain-containing protein [Sphingomicrobium sp.]|nr:DUF4893 domain-containing protein [Sphingomicrobium sp.]